MREVIMGKTIVVVWSLMGILGCTPLYQKLGFVSQEEMDARESVPRLISILHEDVRRSEPTIGCREWNELLKRLEALGTSSPEYVAMLRDFLKRGTECNKSGDLGGDLWWAQCVLTRHVYDSLSRIDANPDDVPAAIDAWKKNAHMGCPEKAVELIMEKHLNTPEIMVYLKKVANGFYLDSANVAAQAAYDELSRLPAAATTVVAGGASPSSGGAARSRFIVAVFDIQDASQQLKRDTLDQLTDYLCTSVSKEAGYRVVPRQQLRERLLDEKKESYKVCYDESCQIELGKAISAQKSLATKIIRIGGRCAITSSLYDLKTETTERSASERTDCSDGGLMDGMDRIARQLAGE
jgi:hypothetical protein